MALIKFVSDKYGKVFIDKENKGEVSQDTVLRITLETGDYLVEIKDNDDSVIIKYKLEIKSTDNQILQDVSKKQETIDDAINQLKNDPSLEFHCNRASFYFNGLYGYVNKRFEVVIPAIYTIANKFKDDKAFVVREFPEGKKTTLVDEDGNMFFNRWFDYLGETDSTILLGVDNRIIVYSKNDFNIRSEYYNAGYDCKSPLIPVRQGKDTDDLCGFINLDGELSIPFIFDKVGNFNENDEAEVSFLGKEIVINRKAACLRIDNGIYSHSSMTWDKIKEYPILQLESERFEYQERYYYYPWGPVRWNFCPVRKNNKWLVIITINSSYKNQDEKKITVECDRIIYLEGSYCICKIGAKIQVVRANIQSGDVDYLWFDADSVVPVLKVDICDASGDDEISHTAYIIKKDGKYGIADRNGEIFISIDYDTIESINPYYALLYKYKMNKIAIVSLNSKKRLTTFAYDNVSLLENGYLLLERNKKYGILIEEDIIPPLYDEIIYSGEINIVKLDGKYGVVDRNNKEILSVEHEEIVKLTEEYAKIKVGKCWSLAYLPNGTIYPGLYDNISLFIDNSYKNSFVDVFLIKRNNKYGCLSTSGKVLIPIEYDKVELNNVCREFSCNISYMLSISFITYISDKVGYFEIAYIYNGTDFGYSYKSFEYLYNVAPLYDKCVLLLNDNSILDEYSMHYAAVCKNGKWGILDQKPREYTYKAIDINLENEDCPNLTDLEFKYESLEELKNDADNEFQKRYDRYYCPWTINWNNGKKEIIKK